MHAVWAEQDAGQINEEEPTDGQQGDDNSNILAGKEHLDIYLNKHVPELKQVMEASDRLSLLYVFHSEITTDSNGQDWRMLDNLFLKVLEELKGGYVTTYAIDCAFGHTDYDSSFLNL